MVDSSDEAGISHRSDRYLIARTAGSCRSCRQGTDLVALVLPPGHETWSPDDALEADGSWERAAFPALLFYVEFLPVDVAQRLRALAPAYRPAFSPETQGTYWANHCGRCGAVQEDHELFCEPEGAFLPLSPGAAPAIELVTLHERFEAAAAGYIIDPEFIECEA